MKKFLILSLALIFIQNICHAIPNPKYLNENAKNSKIKEVATVVKIKNDRKVQNIAFQTVTFKTDDNRTFTGKCTTERKTLLRYRPLVGALYFYPKKGELVYVTVEKDNGEITTYQPVTKEEAIKYKTMPEKIRYNTGKAYLED